MSVADTLIPIINSLQDVFATISSERQTIDLPQIVVVGSQSAGKSSVLEAICGRDILPRGSGIVTRRPLILQLNQTKPGQVIKDKDGKEICEWGEFQHSGDKKFIRHDEICSEIVAETDRETGNTKNVSSKPIGLRLYSPSVIPLTLVDLPGLVKNALPGQPPDIDVQIARCVNEYIARPNAIILAVCAANVDLATADALCAASRVDPNGDRTVGVLTKVDLVDKGAENNIIKIMNNEDYKLKLGWIAVQNRSQMEIDANKPINKHLKDEMNFFMTHPHYKGFSNRCGVHYLTRRLNQVLINHIQMTLPDLKMRVTSQLDKFQKELMSYGQMPEDRGAKERMLLNMISKYEKEYKNMIDGSSAAASKSELVGGARIAYIFTVVLPRMFDTISLNDMLQGEDIRTLIKNSSGIGSGIFLSESAFELLVTKIVRQLEGPCRQCLHLVKNELIQMARAIPDDEIKSFKLLARELVGISCQLIDNLSRPTGKFLQDCITCELAYINTNHPDFLNSNEFKGSIDTQRQFASAAIGSNDPFGGPAPMNNPMGPMGQPMQGPPQMGGNPNQPGPRVQPNLNQRGPGPNPMMGPGNHGQTVMGPNGPHIQGQVNQPPQQGPNVPPVNQGRDPRQNPAAVPESIKAQGPLSEAEKMGVDLIPRLMQSYYRVIRKKIEDTVPKAIVAFLVKASKEQLQETLVRTLYQPDKLDQLLFEDPVVREKRAAAREMVNVLGRANAILEKIGDIRSVEDLKKKDQQQ